MENLQQTKTDALKVKNANNMPFVTIWETKTKKSTAYGFNFESKEVGFNTKNDGVKRTVIAVL